MKMAGGVGREAGDLSILGKPVTSTPQALLTERQTRRECDCSFATFHQCGLGQVT